MKHTELGIASWLYHGWARRWTKPGSDQAEQRIIKRLHASCNRMTKAQAEKEQEKSDFRWCPECMQCRKHRPGSDQCMVCDAKAAKAGKEVTK